MIKKTAGKREGKERRQIPRKTSRIPSTLNSRKYHPTTVHRILFSEIFLEFSFSDVLKILCSPSGGWFRREMTIVFRYTQSLLQHPTSRLICILTFFSCLPFSVREMQTVTISRVLFQFWSRPETISESNRLEYESRQRDFLLKFRFVDRNWANSLRFQFRCALIT